MHIPVENYCVHGYGSPFHVLYAHVAVEARDWIYYCRIRWRCERRGEGMGDAWLLSSRSEHWYSSREGPGFDFFVGFIPLLRAKHGDNFFPCVGLDVVPRDSVSSQS